MGAPEDAEKFWANAPCNLGPEECWPWQGRISGKSYGMYQFQGRPMHAHRRAWELFHGVTAPKGLSACHSCDYRPCVNPHHIWLGTDVENSRDAATKHMSLVWQMLKELWWEQPERVHEKFYFYDWVYTDPQIMRAAKAKAAPLIARRTSAQKMPRLIDGTYRYRLWSGDPFGVAMNDLRCIASVAARPPFRGLYNQCRNERREGNLCVAHAKMQKWRAFDAWYQKQQRSGDRTHS